jgi:prephenate dehydratase
LTTQLVSQKRSQPLDVRSTQRQREGIALEGSFNATMFYADIEGHPEERLVKLAMEELHFYSSEVTVLGTYPAGPFRAELKAHEG